MSNLTLFGGLPMVSVPRYGGGGKIWVSQTPVTKAQYWRPIRRVMRDGSEYVAVTRGLHGRVAVTLMDQGKALQDFGIDNFSRASSGSGEVTVQEGPAFLYRLRDPTLCPERSDDKNHPVVDVSPVQAEAWCALADERFHLLEKGQMIFTLRGGRRKLRYPTSTGGLFDKKGRRLLHGSLDLTNGHVVPASDRESWTCSVRDARYPDGPFGTRLGGNVILIGADDLVFGASYEEDSPENFAGSHFRSIDPYFSHDHIGFCVGVSP